MFIVSWFKRQCRQARPSGRAGTASYRPRVEALESRELLAALVVAPGGSIQAAVNAASPGTTIFIAPGVYTESVTVAKPNLTLIGLAGPQGAVLIENPGGADNGILVLPTASNFTLRTVGVAGFQDNGVLLLGVDHFTLSGVTAVNDGDYGIFPVFSAHGVIEFSTTIGHRDTGIYVGQSQAVTLRNNVTHDNVNGIEIENSTQVQALGNFSFNNTAGLVVDLLPGLTVKTSSNILVQGNFVFNNNTPNFATPGDISSFVPSGTGILVLGSDRTTVAGNVVVNNQSSGVVVSSSLQLASLSGQPPAAFADIEPNPDGDRVQGNIVLNNGTSPSIPSLPAGDLLWDGSGTGNHWDGNLFATSFPPVLPG